MLNTPRRRREVATPLSALPGLAAQVDVDGHEPVTGRLIDISDGRVVIDVETAAAAELLAAAESARLIVHAPGVRFEATTAPSASVTGHAVALVVDPGTKLHHLSA